MKKSVLIAALSTLFALPALASSVKFKDVQHSTGMSNTVTATVTIKKNDQTVVNAEQRNIGNTNTVDVNKDDTIIFQDTATTTDAAQDKDTKCYSLKDITKSCEVNYYALETLGPSDSNLPMAGIHDSSCA
ncbi:MAG: hypothetical protein JXR42_04670 [Gammaproteobacteria bacterium]|nr:hypothetical protein [Gammaproteobacteria bacterium]